MPSRARAFWMIVSSPANYERTKALRFTQQGVKSKYLRHVERMAPGDGMVWYVTGAGTFAATAEVASPYFASKKKIWISDGTPDLYPWRVRTKKQHAVAPENGVRAASLVPKLKFVKRWPNAHWRLAFQGNLHELPAVDFGVIARAVAKR
jgi:EVE domain-containing protein